MFRQGDVSEPSSFNGKWINRDGLQHDVPQPRFKATGATTCTFVVGNETDTGSLQSDGTILWNDGDVWKRKEDFALSTQQVEDVHSRIFRKELSARVDVEVETGLPHKFEVSDLSERQLNNRIEALKKAVEGAAEIRDMMAGTAAQLRQELQDRRRPPRERDLVQHETRDLQGCRPVSQADVGPDTDHQAEVVTSSLGGGQVLQDPTLRSDDQSRNQVVPVRDPMPSRATQADISRLKQAIAEQKDLADSLRGELAMHRVMEEERIMNGGDTYTEI
jgi:hypothetical protein